MCEVVTMIRQELLVALFKAGDRGTDAENKFMLTYITLQCILPTVASRI
jgi:hypothetical protein